MALYVPLDACNYHVTPIDQIKKLNCILTTAVRTSSFFLVPSLCHCSHRQIRFFTGSDFKQISFYDVIKGVVSNAWINWVNVEGRPSCESACVRWRTFPCRQAHASRFDIEAVFWKSVVFFFLPSLWAKMTTAAALIAAPSEFLLAMLSFWKRSAHRGQ